MYARYMIYLIKLSHIRYLNKKVNSSLTDPDAQQRSYICNDATVIL